jgi:type VI protein secretion system component VasA
LRQASTVVATDDESETLEVARFEVEPAEVSLELGTTVNMGDYETVRVTVGVRIPCYVEELVAAYADAENFVKTRLTKERDEVVEWAKKRGARNTNNIF